MDLLIGTTDGLFVNGERVEGEVIRGRIGWLERSDNGWVGIANGSSVFRWAMGRTPEVLARSDGVRLNCVLETGGEVLVGGAGATMFGIREGALIGRPDFAGASGRSDWYTPWGGPPDVRSMSAGPGGVIYVNVHVGGVLVDDAALGWRATMDIDADVHQVVAHPTRAGLSAAATARGLALSHDGAQSWTFHAGGLHASYCRAVTIDQETVFVSASLGSQGRQAAVYRTDLGGGSMDRLATGVPAWFTTNIDTGCLDARNGVLVIGDKAGTIYMAAGPEYEFQVVLEGLPDITCLRIL